MRCQSYQDPGPGAGAGPLTGFIDTGILVNSLDNVVKDGRRGGPANAATISGTANWFSFSRARRGPGAARDGRERRADRAGPARRAEVRGQSRRAHPAGQPVL